MLLESHLGKKVVISEKESGSGLNTSGRNSGVLHSGFYYSPDSSKAHFCADGNRELKSFCKLHKLMLMEIGKVVVTANLEEVKKLQYFLPARNR